MASNHYLTLGLDSSAGTEAIKTRFRQLALAHHPDQNAGSVEAEARFRLIHNAWIVLGDPAAKAEYDRYLKDRSAPLVPPARPREKTPERDTAAEVRDSLNSLLWDVEDLVRRGGDLAFMKDLMRVLTFLDQWILEPAGFVDLLLRHPQKDEPVPRPGRSDPVARPHSRPDGAVHRRLGRSPEPGGPLLSGLRRRSAGEDFEVPRFLPSHPDFR